MEKNDLEPQTSKQNVETIFRPERHLSFEHVMVQRKKQL